jgi:hypothetical protein
VPEGRYFTAGEKKELITRLERPDQSRLGDQRLRRQVTQALNDMELDWRTGRAAELNPRTDQTSRDGSQFGVVKVRPGEGEVTLDIRPGIPARPLGVSIGWPSVSYQVTARDPKSTPRAEVELYVGWMVFRDAGAPRLLAWNGRDYRDVPTTYDAALGIVRGFVPLNVPLVVTKVPCPLAP